MEVFVERDQIPPVRIALEELLLPEDRPQPLLVTQEGARESPRQLHRDLIQGQELAGARRTLNLEIVAVVMVELLERLDNQVVDGKPDRAPPVRVAAKQAAVRL